MNSEQEPLLRVENLHINFATERGRLQALSGVSFDLRAGEIFGLVGETGCGKSLIGLSILGLVPRPGKIVAGTINFRGGNLADHSEAELRQVRGRDIAMIFQDPTTSLNPVFSIGTQLSRVIRQHRRLKKAAAQQEVYRVLAAVGLPDTQRIYRSYPHELSGGMQQRVMIAMALLCEPALIIADEPTTALDVTIQAQILRLLRDVRDRLGIAVLLITHNLGVVASTCDRLAVLYAGRVVEIGTAAEVFTAPKHPYTQGLIAAIPQPERRGQLLTSIAGTVPANPGAIVGCAFASRCPHVFDRCRVERPPQYPVLDTHSAACFLVESEAVHGC